MVGAAPIRNGKSKLPTMPGTVDYTGILICGPGGGELGFYSRTKSFPGWSVGYFHNSQNENTEYRMWNASFLCFLWFMSCIPFGSILPVVIST